MLQVGFGAAYRPNGACCKKHGDITWLRVNELERRLSLSLFDMFAPNRLLLGLCVCFVIIIVFLFFHYFIIELKRKERGKEIFVKCISY
jgi:hypothetical protein